MMTHGLKIDINTMNIESENNNKKTRVGILGGSFDPPTLSHLFIGAELLNQKIVDEVWYIPCGYRTDKKLTDGQIRIEMLKNAIDEFFWASRDKIKIDDIEIQNGSLIP